MPLVGILCILIAAAGWYYMFYSQAAHRLASVEDPAANASRIRLRRVNGVVMIVLALVLYIAIDALERKRIELFSGMLLAVLALMAASMVLALMDVRLTQRLRARRRRDRKD